MNPRIDELRLLIANSDVWTPINHLELELFELENIRETFDSPVIDVNADHFKSSNCKHCLGNLFIYEGALSCEDCGLVETITYDESNPGWSETHCFNIKYRYERIKHFKEQLLNFSGDETKTIPIKLLNKIRAELAEETEEGIMKVLKKYKHIKYYPNIKLISRIILKIQPDRMSKDLQTELVSMFEEIQKPYDKYKGSKRKNFFSYRWILFKFLELIELTNPSLSVNHKSKFSLMKKKTINIAYDIIWEKICLELDWEFIPSVERK